MRTRQRRQSDTEAEFGSDSFLDVISNMVGILIILILMAAFRAKRAPVTAQELITASDPSDIPQITAPPEPTPAPQQLVTENDPEPEPAAKVVDEDHEAEKAALLTRAAQYERLVRRLEAELSTADDSDINAKLAAARSQQQSAEAALRELRQSLERRQQEQAQVRASLEDEQQEIATLKQQLDQVNEQLKVVAARESKKDKLKHKVTPLGLTVYGKELHFRVTRGRISTVPLEELQKVVAEKIRQNASWIVKSNRHQGEVGPIDGYVMKYEVVRASAGVVEDLNRGFGTVKLEVPRFTIEPTLTLRDETVTDALQSDGVFVRTLAQSAPDTVITIWVYPDSFNDYRQLASFAQQQGFIVAARPLPPGLPITGSSHGSRSVGQ